MITEILSTQIGGIVSALLTNDFFEKRLFTLLVRLVLVGVDARSEVQLTCNESGSFDQALHCTALPLVSLLVATTPRFRHLDSCRSLRFFSD
jgi:hypothetical protein